MLDALLNALNQALVVSEGVSDGVNDGVNIKLDDADRQILTLCQQQPYITQDELAEQVGKSLSTIQRRIRKLKHQHLRRIGSDKTGYWKVVAR